ncbi:MAG: dihydroorotase [Kiritimatiellae bacterium]|nr:dihydroorotase [Kiritimatiellia bacterium]MCO5069498.1 dihydroorotase [Kiritimatiellia bacterium]
MTTSFILRNGRALDPATDSDEQRDLFIADGRIVAAPPPHARELDVRGKLVVPGLTDIHVHLREPGGEESETIETGSRAAARGGFTTIVAMPNTRPPHDTAETVAYVVRRGEEVGLTRVLPSGAITVGRKGEELTNLAALVGAGAIAFTDDGATVQDDDLMRRAMDIARDLNRTVMDHAQDRLIELQGGVMHEGAVSKRLGLPGIPTFAEERIIKRDIELAEATGASLHIQHVTSRVGAELIRAARQRGLKVTGELTPHHLALCDEDVDPNNTSYKMNPPLRSRDDRDALEAALLDGTLSCFATDHAPHSAAQKARGFLKAPFGIVGLETAVGITWTHLVRTGKLTPLDWLRRWTLEPARIINRPTPTLAPGSIADIAVLDVETPWIVHPNDFTTKSHNTPFAGHTLYGCAIATFLQGRLVWHKE